MNQDLPKGELRRTFFTIAVCALVYLGFVQLQNQAPLLFLYVVAEDWWGEYATAVAYVTASGLLLGTMRIAAHRRTPGHVLMALGFFFIAMEEISWGQRLLGIRTPHVVAQLNYQNEINLHNSVPIDFMRYFCYGLIAWMFLLPLVTSRSRTVARVATAVGVPEIRLPLMPPFVLALVFLFSNRLENDEVGELILAIAFVYWASDMYLGGRGESQGRSVSRLAFAGGVTALITGATAALVAAGADTDNYRHSVRYSAIVAYPTAGYYDQAAVLFKHMITEPPNPIYDDALFEYGMFLNRIRHPEADAVLQRFLAERYRATDGAVHDDEHRRAGVAFKLLQDHENARRAFQRALDGAARRLQQAPRQSKTGPLFSLAKTYLEMGELPLALKHAHEAREAAQSSRDRLTIQGWVENIEHGMGR